MLASPIHSQMKKHKKTVRSAGSWDRAIADRYRSVPRREVVPLISETMGAPVVLGSFGPRCTDVREEDLSTFFMTA
jgi:hypothetical protein